MVATHGERMYERNSNNITWLAFKKLIIEHQQKTVPVDKAFGSQTRFSALKQKPCLCFIDQYCFFCNYK